MSYFGMLPSFRLVGHEIPSKAWFHTNFPYGPYPLVADSYDPRYDTPQTRYGRCACAGGKVILNNCNFQQSGTRPQCVRGKGCRCVTMDGQDWGCFNRPKSYCIGL